MQRDQCLQQCLQNHEDFLSMFNLILHGGVHRLSLHKHNPKLAKLKLDIELNFLFVALLSHCRMGHFNMGLCMEMQLSTAVKKLWVVY